MARVNGSWRCALPNVRPANPRAERAKLGQTPAVPHLDVGQEAGAQLLQLRLPCAAAQQLHHLFGGLEGGQQLLRAGGRGGGEGGSERQRRRRRWQARPYSPEPVLCCCLGLRAIGCGPRWRGRCAHALALRLAAAAARHRSWIGPGRLGCLFPDSLTPGQTAGGVRRALGARHLTQRSCSVQRGPGNHPGSLL